VKQYCCFLVFVAINQRFLFHVTFIISSCIQQTATAEPDVNHVIAITWHNCMLFGPIVVVNQAAIAEQQQIPALRAITCTGTKASMPPPAATASACKCQGVAAKCY
jgi:hypothetical protein